MKVTFITEHLGAFAGEFKLDNAAARVLIKALEIKEEAENKWPKPNSLHEAYGLLKEEMNEFETEVFLKQSKRSIDNVQSELADIIVVSLRAAGVDIRK
jgi:hypothetical protein